MWRWSLFKDKIIDNNKIKNGIVFNKYPARWKLRWRNGWWSTNETKEKPFYQLAQEQGKFELYLKTDSMEVKILDVDYDSLKKLKKNIEIVKW